MCASASPHVRSHFSCLAIGNLSARTVEFILYARIGANCAGDAIVIYCAGLGPVNPPVAAGDAVPLVVSVAGFESAPGTVAVK
jgi:hypothetical protein